MIMEMVTPFAATVRSLDEIPSPGPVAAAAVIAEIGTDMARFPTAAQLASWATATATANATGSSPSSKDSAIGSPWTRLRGPAAVNSPHSARAGSILRPVGGQGRVKVPEVAA